MHLFDLLYECEKILGEARFLAGRDNGFRSIEELVKLRELLNSQPELEAGGATEERSSS